MIPARRTRIKFCGMTSADEVALAVAAGVDAVGVILAPSARRVPPERVAELAKAIPPFVARVGVLANQGEEEASLLLGLGFTLQFSGSESAERCEMLSRGAPYLKVFHVDRDARSIDDAGSIAFPHALWMFDTRAAGRAGGSGLTFDWTVLQSTAHERAIVVSGGLTSDNVAACVRAVRPYAVDVRSGIETEGRKDVAKMGAFVAAVREADELRMHARID